MSISSDARKHADLLWCLSPHAFRQAYPVSCMHNVSFNKLEEMDTARNDGSWKTDHCQFGKRTSNSIAGVSCESRPPVFLRAAAHPQVTLVALHSRLQECCVPITGDMTAPNTPLGITPSSKNNTYRRN